MILSSHMNDLVTYDAHLAHESSTASRDMSDSGTIGILHVLFVIYRIKELVSVHHAVFTCECGLRTAMMTEGGPMSDASSLGLILLILTQIER